LLRLRGLWDERYWLCGIEAAAVFGADISISPIVPVQEVRSAIGVLHEEFFRQIDSAAFPNRRSRPSRARSPCPPSPTLTRLPRAAEARIGFGRLKVVNQN